MYPSMRRVDSSAAPTALPVSPVRCFSSFHIGAMLPRTLCRAAVDSRNSFSAFFSPSTAERWISSSSFCTTRSPVGGIFATAAAASPQPGAVGAEVPASL